MKLNCTSNAPMYRVGVGVACDVVVVGCGVKLADTTQLSLVLQTLAVDRCGDGSATRPNGDVV